MNHISNHTRQINDLHSLGNILVAKIPKIKFCNPSPFRKTYVLTSWTKQCFVFFEITFHVSFSLSHICSSPFRITDGSKPFCSKGHLTKYAYLIYLKWPELYTEVMIESRLRNLYGMPGLIS